MNQLLGMITIGFVLFLYGLVRAGISYFRPRWGNIAAIPTFGILAAITVILSNNDWDIAGSAVIAAGLVGALSLGSIPRVQMNLVALFGRIARPRAISAIVVVGGICTMLTGMIRFETVSKIKDLADTEYLESVASKPPTKPIEAAAVTDTGKSLTFHAPLRMRSDQVISDNEKKTLSGIPAGNRVIRHEPASDRCNCHGWVFSGGRYWLTAENVEQILTDNGYQTVKTPIPGDVVIYRDDTGYITHTGMVYGAGSTTRTQVIGKWGWMGVYIHYVDESCYGKNYAFYRSSRPGHVVRGVDGNDPTLVLAIVQADAK
ncbi:MAG: hypothetical protein R3B84_02330 [Zavarzinella sp.]